MFVKYEAFERVMVVKYDTLKSGKCSKNYSKTINSSGTFPTSASWQFLHDSPVLRWVCVPSYLTAADVCGLCASLKI